MDINYFKGPWQARKRSEANLERFSAIFPKLTLFDLGAAGGTPPPFLFLANRLGVVTFEPEPDAQVAANGINCPVAVGPQECNKLYINRRPTTSSLLKPNADLVNRYDWERIFPGQGNIFETIRELDIETTPVDEAINKFELPKPDFLKIDVQGLTYEVLKGSERALLDSVMGVQVEMEFSKCYKNQKTFGAVHELLQDLGFEVFGVTNLNSWTYLTERHVDRPRGQDTFCDITYFRPIDGISENKISTREELEKIIGLLLLFDFNDAAMAFLEKGLESKLIEEEHLAFNLVAEWPGSLDYFYMPRNKTLKFLDKVLSVSPKRIINFVYRRIRRVKDLSQS